MELAIKVRKEIGRGLISVLCLASVCVAHADITGNYSYISSGSLVLIRLTQTKSTLSGFMQSLGTDTISRQGYSLRSSQFVGNLDGTNFTLRGGPDCEGKVSGRKLQLQFPTRDGRTTTLVLSPTTEAAWNKSVSEFQHKQAIWAQVWDFSRIYSDYVNGFEKTAKSSQDDLRKAEVKRPELQGNLNKADLALAKAKKAVEQAKAKLAEAQQKEKVANDKAKELERVADKEESDAARKRAYDARNAAYEAGVKVHDAESAVYSAESEVYGCDINLDHAQNQFKWNEEQATEAKQTLGQLKVTSDVLRADESIRVLAAVSKGRIIKGIVPAQVKLFFYASEDSLSTATLKSGAIITVVRVSSKWSMVALFGRIYWIRSDKVSKSQALDVKGA